MKVIGVILARCASTRFPGKPLADICGTPMIWWVYQRAIKVKSLSEVYIATEDERIANVCEELYIPFLTTSADHNTSTDQFRLNLNFILRHRSFRENSGRKGVA